MTTSESGRASGLGVRGVIWCIGSRLLARMDRNLMVRLGLGTAISRHQPSVHLCLFTSRLMFALLTTSIIDPVMILIVQRHMRLSMMYQVTSRVTLLRVATVTHS